MTDFGGSAYQETITSVKTLAELQTAYANRNQSCGNSLKPGLYRVGSLNIIYDSNTLTGSGSYSSYAALQADQAAGLLVKGVYQVGNTVYRYNGVSLKKDNLQSFAPIAQMSYLAGSGNNSALNVTGSTASAPVPWPLTAANYTGGNWVQNGEITLPANVGDTIEYYLSLCLATNASSGLNFYVISCGGSAYRDWYSGKALGSSVTTISGTAFYSAAAGYTTPTGLDTAKCANKVLPSDLDASGMITLRLYVANSTVTSGTYSYTLFAYWGSGSHQIFAINHRNGKQTALNSVTAYPGGNSTNTGIVNTSGTLMTTYNPVTDSSATKTFDIVIPANVFDLIKYELFLSLAQSGNCRPNFSVWSVGGSLMREWLFGYTCPKTGITGYGAKGLGQYNTTGGAVTVNAFCMQRVLDTDLDTNGNVTLRLFTTDWNQSLANNTAVINATDSFGRVSYARALNIPAEYTLLYGFPTGLSNGSPQEPSLTYWNGVWNLLFTMGGYLGQSGTWWATSPNMNGPFTLQGNTPLINGASQNNVYTENGLLYVYYRSPSSGNLAVKTASTFAAIAAAPELTVMGRSSFNSAIVKHPSGTYYLWADDGNAGSNHWLLYLATAKSPLGPFTLLAGAMNGLNFAGATVGGSPWVEWTGDYFRLFFHTAPVAGAVVPTHIYQAISTDGINWVYPNLRLDGSPTAMIKNPAEFGWNQVADPFMVRVEDDLYCIFDSNQGTAPAAVVMTRLEALNFVAF